jgi:hypothetical protein
MRHRPIPNNWYQSEVTVMSPIMSQSSVHGSSPTARRRPGSSSPSSCRPHHRDGRWQVIVEKVIEKSMAGIVYPMLTRTNYIEWSVVMYVNLQTAGLWEAVQYDGVEYRDDCHALVTLLRAVPADMQAGLANKEAARDAWELIRRIHMGADRVKEANAERLRQECADRRFKSGACVEDFSIHITCQ